MTQRKDLKRLMKKNNCFKEVRRKNHKSKVREANIIAGELILANIMAFEEVIYLADTWSKYVYIVVYHVNKDIPLFEIKHENGQDRNILSHIVSIFYVTRVILSLTV